MDFFKADIVRQVDSLIDAAVLLAAQADARAGAEKAAKETEKAAKETVQAALVVANADLAAVVETNKEFHAFSNAMLDELAEVKAQRDTAIRECDVLRAAALEKSKNTTVSLTTLPLPPSLNGMVLITRSVTSPNSQALLTVSAVSEQVEDQAEPEPEADGRPIGDVAIPQPNEHQAGNAVASPAASAGDAALLQAEAAGDAVPLQAEAVGDAVPLQAEVIGDAAPLPAEAIGDAAPLQAEAADNAVPLPAEEVERTTFQRRRAFIRGEIIIDHTNFPKCEHAHCAEVAAINLKRYPNGMPSNCFEKVHGLHVHNDKFERENAWRAHQRREQVVGPGAVTRVLQPIPPVIEIQDSDDDEEGGHRHRRRRVETFGIGAIIP